MPSAYYGARLSNNLVELSNGCLLCKNVPIARTGVYKYLRSEVGMEGQGIVDVYRDPEEVFSQAAIASFEGKPFTDTHPNEDVTIDNWSQYSKGVVRDVRKGVGDQEGYLVADILVTDPISSNEIVSNAKREISSGYDCDYVVKDGKIYQTNIRGNHVALVQYGRAGSKVRINDEKLILPKKYFFIKTIDKAIKMLDKEERAHG